MYSRSVSDVHPGGKRGRRVDGHGELRRGGAEGANSPHSELARIPLTP